MKYRSNVSPATLSVELVEGGVAVEYLDGRETFYHGVPEAVEGPVRAAPRRHLHVLVTDPSGTEGVLTYVNDRTSHDDVLESTGVGRVLLEADEREELFPGVAVEMDGLAPVVSADLDLVDGRVFVFEEDEIVEKSYEIVPEDEAGSDDEDTGEEKTDDGEDTGEEKTDDGED
ncbi:hypothetical protein BRD00_11945 [Halobacteriales archaeon QS_8_69_26]|nr:MAG: hypothetical protein BRD00_11945 [Halobacteriales archaeon QS_8_69_26]